MNAKPKKDFQCADLRGADLRGADLRDADLRYADLRGSDLFNANLRAAVLSDAKGVIFLDVQDPRGYLCYIVNSKRGPVIIAGCRNLKPDQALAHWGDERYHTPEIGQFYVAAINCWLTTQANDQS